MPFVSESQRKWMHANHPEMAQRWEKETPRIKDLPAKVEKVREVAHKIKRGLGNGVRNTSHFS